MFGVDFPEIIIICGVALVVLGPKKLPGAAAKVGRWVGHARSMARQFREQLEQEISSAENAADIRKEVDSAAAETRTQPGAGAGAAQSPGTPPKPAPGESVPPEAVSHGTTADEPAPQQPMPFEPGPYEAGPYQMPPPEGYGPSPQQLTFDAQLHDTALPPASASSSAAREWMPETQTWMASAGWEVPDSAAGAASGSPQPTSTTPRQPAAQPPSTHAPEPDAATPSSRPKAVEHEDR